MRESLTVSEQWPGRPDAWQQPATFSAPEPLVHVPPPRRRSALPTLLVVLLLTLAAFAVLRWALPEVLRGGPPAGLEEQALPIGAPPLGAPATGPYSFMQTQDDGVTPVTYSPCRPIHYVVRPDGAPTGGDTLVATAFAQISQATGLRFVADGPTSERPSPEREAYQPDRYGRRWAPVLVVWSHPEETPDLAGDVAGHAGSSSVTVDDGPAHYVTGSVVLDGPAIGALLTSPNGTAVAQGVVTHEVAHLVGLGHVDDPGQLMNPTAALNQTYLGNGDLAGLAKAGTGPCAPEL